MSDTLDKFGIKVQYFIVANENNIPIKFVTTGGIEVINETKDDDGINEMLDSMKDKDILRYIDGRRMPFRYVETPFNIDKLKELLKYKSIKSLSKEKALKINSDIKSKTELENDIVYITDKEPTTNSLALAKQFDLEHKNVILKLFELGSMYPSVLMKIKADVYHNKVKAGGGRIPKNSGLDSAEYSAGIKSADNYQPFYHVHEDVYYLFLKKLGTPKCTDTPKGMVKLVHREDKQDEYFKAFQTLRTNLLNSGITEKEIESLIKVRTQHTKALMSAIYDYVTKYNGYHKDKHLNLVNANKLIFNIINYINDINAINYVPPTDEEIKSNTNRKTKDEALQAKLLNIEYAITASITLASKYHASLIEVLSASIDKTEDEIKQILMEYNSDYLLDEL